jgi:hypothetical protein
MPALSTTRALVVYVVRKAKAEIVSQKPAATLWQLAAAAIVVIRAVCFCKNFVNDRLTSTATPV